MPNPKPKKRLSPYLVPFATPRAPRMPERAAADVSRVTPHDPVSPTAREIAGALGLGLGEWFYRTAALPFESAADLAKLPIPGAAPVFGAIAVSGLPARMRMFREESEAELREAYGDPTSTEARAARLIASLAPDLLPLPGARGAIGARATAEAGSPAVRTARARLRAERAIPAPNLPDVASFRRAGYDVSESPLFSMLRQPEGAGLREAVRANLDAPGFTLDATGKPFAGSGYAVALGDEFTAPLRGARDIDKFLARADVKARLEQPGHYIGGWRDPATGQGEINVTRMFDDQRAAVGAARRYKQKAYGEFKDGEYVGDRDYIASPAVIGADGVTYRGANHGDAREAAAKALRRTPEGRAAMQRNGGNAVLPGQERLFELGNGDLIPAKSQRAADIARSTGQAPRLAPEYQDLHSSDLGPPKGPPDEPPAAAASPARIPEPPRAPPTLLTSPKGRALSDALLQDETARLNKRNIPQFEAAARTLPSSEAFGAGALAGAPKLGWYANSARALSEAYGPDAPRFAALLSALSPQQPVHANLAMAMDSWEVWNAAGRPTGKAEITRLLDDVARRNPQGKQMGSRVPNAITALTTADPMQLVLSGPKVFSFHGNLIGDAQRVTLDTWMAKLGGLDPNKMSAQRGAQPGRHNPLYLAYSGRVRETADMLSRTTGRQWSPAEVQETLWSWGKALTETAEPMARGVHPSLFEAAGIAPQGMRDLATNLPRSTIEGVPDFASLLRQEPYAGSLARQGLPAPSPTRPIPFAGPAPDPFSLDELVRNLEKTLKSERGMAGSPRQKAPGRLVFHGTTVPGFNIPSVRSNQGYGSGLGAHVGTSGQADEILRGAPYDAPSRFGLDPAWRPPGSRIIPLRDYSRNPVYIKQDRGWGDPVYMAEQLVNAGALTPDDLTHVTKLPGEGWPYLRRRLQEEGYDSVVYPNRVEADRWTTDRWGRPHKVTSSSRVVIDPERHLRGLFDPPPAEGVSGTAMLAGIAGAGAAAAGLPLLWQRLRK